MGSPRVGLIGCGGWGSLILRDLTQLGCDVSVVARSPESRSRARQHGKARIVGSIEELGSVDGIVVATPTSTHADVLEEALQVGVPIYVEKPLCDDERRAVALAERGAGRLFVMDKWRYHGGVRLLAQIARSGELGRIRGVRSIRIGWGTSHPDVDCVWTLAPHDLAIALEILGRLPPATSAWGAAVGGRVTELVGVLGDDPFVVCEIGDRSPATRREVLVLGDDGTAILRDGYSEEVSIYRPKGDPHATDCIEQRRPFSAEMPLLAELRAFVEHLAGGPPPCSSGEEGAAIVQRIARWRELAGLKGRRCDAA